MSEIPGSWAWSTLEHLSATSPRSMTDGPFGSNLKTAHYTDAGPRVIRLQNIGDGVFNDVEAHISPEHFASLTSHSVEAGDLVVASLGTDLPRACLVPASLPPAIVKADCIRVRLHSEIDAKYVNFALQRPELRRKTQDEIHGVGRPRIGMTGVRAFTVPVPPLPEQRRIVAAIEEHFSRLDAAEESLSNATRRMEAFVASNVNRAFDDLDERMPLGELAEVNGGIQKQPKRRPTMNKFPFLRVANVKRNQLELEEVHEIELFGDEIDRYRLEKGDLLVVEGNGSPEQIGRSAVWEGEIDDCVHQNHLIRVRPGSDLEPRFLNMFWNSSVNARQLASVASSTSGLYTLSTSKLKRVEIPITSESDQLRIADDLDAVFEMAARIQGELASAQRRSSALRRAILVAAFSGRLVPQDPSDEPASRLLERVAAERVAAKPSRRKKQATS